MGPKDLWGKTLQISGKWSGNRVVLLLSCYLDCKTMATNFVLAIGPKRALSSITSLRFTYLVRSVYLKNTRTGETRTVTQFHFRSWPAHGVPSSTKALLEFRRKVNKSYRGRSCPIVVHCSDGVGRSGTYVLIDMVLNRLSKGCKEIDIAATLEHIRDQRGGMVQNRQQFEFCLMACFSICLFSSLVFGESILVCFSICLFSCLVFGESISVCFSICLFSCLVFPC